MAAPSLSLWTLSISPARLETEFWASSSVSATLRSLDCMGIFLSVIINLSLARLHARNESYSCAPLIALASGAVQLWLMWGVKPFYERHRHRIQMFQRVMRLVPACVYVVNIRAGVTMLSAVAHAAWSSGELGQRRLLAAALLGEPGLAVLSALNYNVPFKLQLVLFGVKLVLDLFAVAPAMACTIKLLGLEPFAGPWCMGVEAVAAVFFAISPPNALHAAGSMCAVRAARFLPAAMLLWLGGMLPLLCTWWFEARLKLQFIGASRSLRPWVGVSNTMLLVLQLFASVGMAYSAAWLLVKLAPARACPVMESFSS